jgi:serine/threonine protein kinase
MEQLLTLQSQATVHVRGDCFEVNETFVELFGDTVFRLDDLACDSDTGDLEALVNEIRQDGIPVKRGMTLNPIGTDLLVHCNVSGVQHFTEESVILSFQVIDSGSRQPEEGTSSLGVLRDCASKSSSGALSTSSKSSGKAGSQSKPMRQFAELLSYEADSVRAGNVVRGRLLTCPVDIIARMAGSTKKKMLPLQKEVALITQLRHPHVMLMIGSVALPIGSCLISEASCCTVAERMARNPLPVDQGVRVALQVSRALEYLHVRRCYHGAIEASSIFLCGLDPPVAKIGEFIASRFLDSSESPAVLTSDVHGFVTLLFELLSDEKLAATISEVQFDSIVKRTPLAAPLLLACWAARKDMSGITAEWLALTLADLDAVLMGRFKL